MLRWRLLLGAALIAVFAGLCWLDARSATPGSWLFPLAVVVCPLAAGEVLWLLASAGHRPLRWVVYAGNLLVVGSNAVPLYLHEQMAGCPVGPLGWPLAALAVGVILAFVGEMRRYRQPGGVIVNVALAVFSMGYVGLMLSFAIQLRLLGGTAAGVMPLAALIVAVKMGDTGAYTVGRLIGRHRLAPVLSPGKTIEGAAGAVLFSAGGTWGLLAVFQPQTPWWVGVLFGVVLAVAGMIGDLAESLLKRDVGRKDSSAWVPGFGGVLDVLDSILLSAPVAYLLWVVLVEP